MEGRDGRTTWSGNPDGIWYHWVITFAGGSGGALNVYRDSALVHGPSTLHNWTVTTDDTPIYFGARNVKGLGYNNGWATGLEEVAIFDEVKDSDWVTSTYYNGNPADLQGQSGLVGYWKFNEGSGTTVKDYGPYEKHGTLTTADYGLPTWSEDVPKG